MTSVDVMDEKKKRLRRAAMNGKWSEVYDMFVKDRTLRTAKITATEDTVIHMAVSSEDENMVAKMVDIVCEEQYPKDEEDGDVSCIVRNVVLDILGAENKGKNTPLHLAASMGNVEMCKKIGYADAALISKRNVKGETPLFLAALNGKRKAFLWLHYISNNDTAASSPNCKNGIRNDGNTILHCAIEEGHFDVAIEIVHLYKDLVKGMLLNQDNLSPLHLLAAWPSAFKSNTRLGRPFGYLAYHCLRVKKKEHATTKEELEGEYNFRDAVVKCIGAIRRTENKMFKKFINPVLQGLLEFSAQVIYDLNGVRKKKETHTWSLQIMEELLKNACDSEMSAMRTPSEKPSTSSEKQEDKGKLGICGCKHPCSPHCGCGPVCGPAGRIETPLMIATKNGVIEMMKKIVELFPSTIDDVNDEGKNIVLLAAEKRQTEVYQFLCESKMLNESLFRQVDREGNSALHLAAKYGDERNWEFPGEALAMQWEFKWLKYVRDSVSPGVFPRYNKNSETPDDIFTESHKKLKQSDIEWLTKTSEACSLVSTLIATVAFATTASLPGGFDQNKGFPLLREKPAFGFFAGSSLMALCFSLISTILFLSIVTSRYQAVNFFIHVPSMLFLGMSFMFLSIACMWLSFCAGHSFLLHEQSRKIYTYVYILASIPITLFAFSKFPVYFDLLTSNFTKVPAPSHQATPAIIKHPRNKKKEDCTDENDQN